MRGAILTLVLASGCATWSVDDRAADLVTVLSREEQRKTAIAAVDDRGRKAWLRADTIDLMSGPPRNGRRDAYPRFSVPQIVCGLGLGALGFAVAIGGAAILDSEERQQQHCVMNGNFLCFGPIAGPTLVGIGVPSFLSGLIIAATSGRAPVEAPDGPTRLERRAR